MNAAYVETVRLLLAAAPAVFESGRFAMKGGTAINLFVQPMPRLSVDIDCTFIDHTLGRDDALLAISDDLERARLRLLDAGFQVQKRGVQDGDWKMIVTNRKVVVKIEVNVVFRGTLLPVSTRDLVSHAQDLFTTNITVPVLEPDELYGGKLVAAMDRQHPRDLFDVHRMLEGFGLTEMSVASFVAYLAGHNRPVHEVLFPAAKPLEALYQSDFIGMTIESVALTTLIETQNIIQERLPGALTADQRRFLLSLVQLDPQWDCMPMFPNLDALPAIQWKLQNLAQLRRRSPTRFAEQYRHLQERFASLSSSNLK